ncbi:MAG: maleylpyruvate isomerase N-terminal domain-containing protein [Phyllobacteriaceae bacterium]|nr:maleylpyruvate isomerase N-terminal domain-containing protein [Phyllobacteriaceae bacterium]
MSDTLDKARAALRQRQGAGARYDAERAPAVELDWARRGTAYFARLLNGLSDADLDAPSRLDGVSRRHVVAHVGYHARKMSDIVSWARQGKGDPMPDALLLDGDDVAARATQPARALRNLFAHAGVHLNVEWRDLGDAEWDVTVTDVEGRSLAVRETPWLRARTIWLSALDLDAGGRLADAPPEFVERLAQTGDLDRATGQEGLAHAEMGASGHERFAAL